MAPAEAVNEKFAHLTSELRDAIEKLGQPDTKQAMLDAKTRGKQAEQSIKDKDEIGRLSGVVETLQNQLSESISIAEGPFILTLS